MNHTKVGLTDAKSRLDELVERAARGEEIVITRYGRPVARLVGLDQPRLPVDKAMLQRLTDSQPQQTEPASRLMSSLRQDSRY